MHAAGQRLQAAQAGDLRRLRQQQTAGQEEQGQDGAWAWEGREPHDPCAVPASAAVTHTHTVSQLIAWLHGNHGAASPYMIV